MSSFVVLLKTILQDKLVLGKHIHYVNEKNGTYWLYVLGFGLV